MINDDLIIVNGWLVGTGVQKIETHPSWYSGLMVSAPKAIVAHYSATNAGTAVNMAKRRTEKRTATDRAASWHLSIDSVGDRPIVQMAPFKARCWHAGGPGSKPIPLVGRANLFSVGIELIGHGDAFTAQQVINAARVWRALVRAYKIPAELAMIEHSKLSPHDRKDPGPIWMQKHAPGVLEHAFRK